MEKKVLAVKMKMNLYYLMSVMSLIAAVLFVLLYVFEKREERFLGWLYLLFAAVLFVVFVYNLVAGIQVSRLPKELIVYQNGKLTVFTRRGRADVSLHDVLDINIDMRGKWYSNRRDMFSEHRLIVQLPNGVLRVDMVEDVQFALKGLAELRAQELSQDEA